MCAGLLGTMRYLKRCWKGHFSCPDGLFKTSITAVLEAGPSERGQKMSWRTCEENSISLENRPPVLSLLKVLNNTSQSIAEDWPPPRPFDPESSFEAASLRHHSIYPVLQWCGYFQIYHDDRHCLKQIRHCKFLTTKFRSIQLTTNDDHIQLTSQ